MQLAKQSKKKTVGRTSGRRKGSYQQRRGRGRGWSARESKAKNMNDLDREAYERVQEEGGEKRGTVTRGRKGCPGLMTEEVRGVSNSREG